MSNQTIPKSVVDRPIVVVLSCMPSAIHRVGIALCTACLLLTCVKVITGCDDQHPIRWDIKMLTVDRNEGIDIGDIDRDGKLDIVAGRNWYLAPEFAPRPLRTIEDWNGYVESNGDFLHDVDGDGWPDLIAGSFLPTEVYWFRNPGKEGLKKGKLWEKHLLVDTRQSTNEGQLLVDLNRDGRPEWLVNSWQKQKPLIAWELQPKTDQQGPAMTPVTLGKQFNGHGMAVGDLNGDQHQDVMVGTGWYENPGTAELTANWKYHPDWDLHASVPCVIHDWNRDGKNDLVIGNGHDFGLFLWIHQGADPSGQIRWKKSVVDDRFSQPHCLHLADLDGDSTPELITGKRVEAHNGNDPGGNQPPCLYFYRWDTTTMSFQRQTIDEGHVGTGLQIRTADINQDGRTDIAVAGKSGTYLLLNLGPQKK